MYNMLGYGNVRWCISLLSDLKGYVFCFFNRKVNSLLKVKWIVRSVLQSGGDDENNVIHTSIIHQQCSLQLCFAFPISSIDI